jgi:hypothetical protein
VPKVSAILHNFFTENKRKAFAPAESSIHDASNTAMQHSEMSAMKRIKSSTKKLMRVLDTAIGLTKNSLLTPSITSLN